MKTPQKENKQVYVLIKFVLICIIIIFGGFIVTKCEAQTTKPDTGYYIWVKNKGKIYDDKFISIDEAQHYLNGKFYLTQSYILPDLKHVLSGDSLMYEQRTLCYWIYCEKMRIIYKKNGKIKFKRIKIH